MKLAFRIECSHCHWGYPWHDGYVNQGWVKLRCAHCDKEFYTKITISNINIETSKELPSGIPCKRSDSVYEPTGMPTKAFVPQSRIQSAYEPARMSKKAIQRSAYEPARIPRKP